MTTHQHTYTPQPGSLPSQVIGFFKNNPDEELGIEEITDKFDTPRGNIHTTLRGAVDAGLLQRDRNADGDYIYKRGQALPTPTKVEQGLDMDAGHARRTPTGTTPKSKGNTAGGFSAPRVAVDFDALRVDEGVPIPAKGYTGNNKWQPLFDKLTKPGQSIALPHYMRGAVGAAAAKVNRLKTQGAYRVARMRGDQCRIFRTA